MKNDMTEKLTDIVCRQDRFVGDEKAIALAVNELAAWASRHHSIFIPGRKHGFEIGISEELRSALLLLGSNNTESAVANMGSFSWSTPD